jgi:hypothetical protein
LVVPTARHLTEKHIIYFVNLQDVLYIQSLPIVWTKSNRYYFFWSYIDF